MNNYKMVNREMTKSQFPLDVKNKKVLVAMSGGVDSSVAAAVLKRQGAQPIGIFLKFWSPNSANSKQKSKNNLENKCCSYEAAEQARRVANKLKIPFYVLNFRQQFKKTVVDYFISEYRNGRTPNPCVKCNQMIKFGLLFKKAKELGTDFLATGHYARIAPVISKEKIQNSFHSAVKRCALYSFPADSAGSSCAYDPLFTAVLASFPTTNKNTQLALFEAKDKQKDQSYFLWTLKPEQLKHIIFPIGDYSKEQVRKMAKNWGLPTALRPDSQEICFVWGTVTEFLADYLKPKTGKIINQQGKILGKHNGAIFYTIGQRQNLNIKPASPIWKPYYVIETDTKKNLVIVGREKDLYSKELVVKEVNWIDEKFKNQNSKCLARIRYGHPNQNAKIKMQKSKLLVEFEKSQRAITPGQSIVFYQGEEVLGGGVIE